MVGKEVLDGERGHGGDLLVAHQAHGFVAELIGVIDGGHASANGIKRAGLARGVDRNALADASSFTDGGAEFGFVVLVGPGPLSILESVFAGFVAFYEIRTPLSLFADFVRLLGLIR